MSLERLRLVYSAIATAPRMSRYLSPHDSAGCNFLCPTWHLNTKHHNQHADPGYRHNQHKCGWQSNVLISFLSFAFFIPIFFLFLFQSCFTDRKMMTSSTIGSSQSAKYSVGLAVFFFSNKKNSLHEQYLVGTLALERHDTIYATLFFPLVARFRETMTEGNK